MVLLSGVDVGTGSPYGGSMETMFYTIDEADRYAKWWLKVMVPPAAQFRILLWSETKKGYWYWDTFATPNIAKFTAVSE